MNLYIFFTGPFLTVGGMQQYILGKIKALKTIGWEIIVFAPQPCIGNSVYEELNDYAYTGNDAFWYTPDCFSEHEKDIIFENSIKAARVNIENYEKICIESHFEIAAFWGEYFAYKMNAKHHFCAINELFRGENKLYEKYMDFFKFKLNRHEISGRVKQLFEGYLEIKDLPEYESWVIEKNPIEDVYSERIDTIKKEEYNIGLISRGEKDYVPNVLQAISDFCRKNKESQFLVVLVGDYTSRTNEIGRCFLELQNVRVYSTGNLVPIPKKLYEKLDVVLANSAAAMFSAYQNVPVIVVSHKEGFANGVLGYDCDFDESIYLKGRDPDKKTVDLLEKILIKKEYNSQKPMLPEPVNEVDFHKKKLDYFNSNIPNSKNDYYHFHTKYSIKEIRPDLYKNSKKYKYRYLNSKELNKAKIVVFGAGREGIDCINWLNGIGKDVLFVADNDVAKMNTEIENIRVVGPDEIRKIEEDYFVIIANLSCYEEIEKQLMDSYAIPEERCIPYRYLQDWPMIGIYY